MNNNLISKWRMLTSALRTPVKESLMCIDTIIFTLKIEIIKYIN